MAKIQLMISQDNEPSSPREWDNLGSMVCWHDRYNLSDDEGLDKLKDTIYEASSHTDCSDWSPSQFLAWLENNDFIILPLYLYDHGGITMSTSPFACRWDSGQVGFIYVSKADVRENWSVKRISQQLKDKALKVLQSEVETYDQYLRGDVYGFQLQKVRKDGTVKKELDSCWGFYGDDIKTNGIMDHIPTKYQNVEVIMPF